MTVKTIWRISLTSEPGQFRRDIYVEDENRRADWLIEKRCTPKDFFTPPHETAESLHQHLAQQDQRAVVETVEAMAWFLRKK